MPFNKSDWFAAGAPVPLESGPEHQGSKLIRGKILLTYMSRAVPKGQGGGAGSAGTGVSAANQSDVCNLNLFHPSYQAAT